MNSVNLDIVSYENTVDFTPTVNILEGLPIECQYVEGDVEGTKCNLYNWFKHGDFEYINDDFFMDCLIDTMIQNFINCHSNKDESD